MRPAKPQAAAPRRASTPPTRSGPPGGSGARLPPPGLTVLDPGTVTGIAPRELLALQRLAGNRTVSRLIRAGPGPVTVQRGGSSKRVVIGEATLYDAAGKQIGSAYRFDVPPDFIAEAEAKGTPVMPGVFKATIKQAGSALSITWGPYTDLPLVRFSNKQKLLRELSGATSTVLAITVGGGSLVKKDYQKPPPGKAAAGPGSQGQATGKQGGGAGGQQKGGGRQGAGGQKGGGGQQGGGAGGSGGQGRPGGPKQGGAPGQGKQPGPQGVGGRAGGTGTGIGTKPGSKYGWLGWLELPQEVIDVLEAGFEALGDAEEFQALQELIVALSELAKNAGALEALLDTDRLLGILLGLEENAALDALETWATAQSVVRKPKQANPKLAEAGILALAQRIANLVAKVRRVLSPVFKGRRAFLDVLGAAGLVIEQLPILDELVAMAADPKRSKEEFQLLVETFGQEAAAAFQEHLEAARAAIELQVERFDKLQDLVKQEDIAKAVTRAAALLVPTPYKPIAWAARKLGLESLVADNLVAPLIPKDLVDAMNGVLTEVSKEFGGVVKQTKKQLDLVFTRTEKAVADDVIPELKGLLMPSRTSGDGALPAGSELGAVRLTRTSTGEALDEGVRRDMEALMGSDFGRVRVHRDVAAHQASELLQANAFTLDEHVYFGPGRYDPGSRDGRRLLAHELTHVVQQGGGHATGVVQRDFKDAVAALANKVGDAAKETVRKLVRPRSMKSAAQAEKIINQVDPLIGRTVVSENNPRLPSEAYFYTKNRKGVIKGIRRKLAWVGSAIPKLKIDGGKIVIGSVWDPKKAARAKLRAALGTCRPNEQAHHVIPLELRSHPVVKLAEKNGFDFNGAANGYCLPEKVHSTSHPVYTGDVRDELDAIQRAVGAKDWGKVEPRLDQLVKSLKRKLYRVKQSGKRLT